MNKRLISLVLTFIMLITMVPSTIVEASEVTTMESVKASSNQSEVTKPEENTIYAVNPLYEDVISIDDLKKKLDSSNDEQLFGSSTGQYFSDYDSAVLYLRKQMVSRETEINLNFPESWFTSHKDGLYWDLLYDAMKCDDSSTGQEGDALLYGYAGCNVSYSTAGYIKYTMAYHSNAEQEAKLTEAVAVAMAKLQLNGLSEAKKITKIHDYICNHVDYEYNSKEEQIYTAYGALCTGKAVCQGYAVLFYRLCKEAGLSVRIISGTGNGGPHAWNIVRIGSKYYNVDCTWDGQDAATYNEFLLKSEADFRDHTRESWKVAGSRYLDYTSAEFNAQYPMTEKSWDESTTYAHSKEDTSGAVTLKAEWNDPVLGQPTTFHVSATGGSGNYKFRMDAPSYSDPNQWEFESVADPSRGEWMNYTSECASNDYTFTMTATGTYNFRFYVMDTAAEVTYLRVNFNISVSDDKYPSVDSIVRSAVAECNSKTDGSEYAKALWLHDWLLDQLEYDKTLKWSSAESALTRGFGTCQSYESAYAKLLTAAGIENSETRDTYDGHTWNAMKLDGQWYQTDCTWDDSSDNWYSFDQRHLYFGLTDELMAIAHPGHSKIYTTDDYKTRSTSLADNYFVRAGDAEKWAKAYSDRIQKNLDAGKTEFEIAADNASYPPSISGIQNGIIAYAINQMTWTTDKAAVTLNATGNAKSFTFTAEYASESPAVSLYGRSITLKDNIDVNYYMEMSDSVFEHDAYLEFKIGGQTYKLNASDAAEVNENGKTLYKFSCPVNAAQMSDTIETRIVIDNKTEEEYLYSVKEYATELLSKSNEYPAETIKLVKALLNYGTAAQNFFKYNTDKPANAGLSDTDKAVAAADFEEYKAVIKTDSANGQSNGLTYYGSSLICKSEMTVRHYFMVNEGCDINNYKFSYVNADGNEVSLTPKKASDGVYCVDINGIMARNLNSNYACKVTGKNKACIFELDYGPFSYSQKVINSGNSSDKLKNLVNALYWYWYYGYRN
ncbi:transglutaminase domain-containing protein [Agathobacter rectalis]|uniref:transglutaminase domain-containing protein n=1 Tax=Agathobacter rectalis TaxID=39491 RepID=UPI0027D22481|nr:transglutaminase domain-containing protein [Agathobacter rectalis]